VSYSGFRGKDEVQQIDIGKRGSHGGGDEFLLKNFVKTIKEKNSSYNLTTVQKSLQSHLMAFASEESRVKEEPIDFKQYKKNLGLK